MEIKESLFSGRVKKTVLMSVPRSGHHFIAQNLSKILGSLYCEGYWCRDAYFNPIRSCPKEKLRVHRGSCGKDLPIVKNHDLELRDSIDDFEAVLVLRRADAYSSIISMYEYGLRNKDFWWDSRRTFNSFLEKKIPYLLGFNAKYGSRVEDSRFLRIYYEDLFQSNSGIELFKQILDFLGLPEEAAKLRTDSLITLKSPRDPSAFRHFSKEDMNYINDLMARTK